MVLIRAIKLERTVIFFHNQVFECEGHKYSMGSLPAMAGLSSMLGSLKARLHKTKRNVWGI